MKHSGPLLGYNNNIPHLGNVFHVQTEDSGTKRPHVITHLFADGGRIVKTLKTSYAQYVSAENVTDKVRALMRDQHKSMVLSLRDGDFDHLIEEGRAEIEEREAPRSMPPPSVESIEPASAPLELLERAASVNEREFHQEMERLTTTPAAPESVRRATPPTGEGPGSYSFVGRGAPPARERSAPPQRSSPPAASKPSAGGSSASGRSPSGAIPRPVPRRMRSTRPPDDSNPPREEDAPPALDVTNPRRMRITRDGPPDSENRATSVYKRNADHVRTKPDLKAAHDHAAVASPFGERFVSARRFDEVVAAFIARGE